MPRTPVTRNLLSIAHSDGDDYYRRLVERLKLEPRMDPECFRLANAYLSSLQELARHLDSLKESEDTTNLRNATAKFISYVHKDLDRERGGGEQLMTRPSRKSKKIGDRPRFLR